MNPRFESHRLTKEALVQVRAIGASYDQLVSVLQALWGPACAGNYKYKALDLLEQSCFYAKKVLAVEQDNQEPEVR